jgi:Polyketide cyclase / dehydrase and lipid transport
MSNPRYFESIVVGRPPEFLYDMVSDVTRMGEWSPICTGCWWDEGGGPRAGAWFTGRNETPERVWDTRSQVVTAEHGREFTFLVEGDRVRWSYAFAPADGGTELTESWEFLPAGIARFHDRYGADAEAQIAERTQAAHQGITVTLAAIKKAAESGPAQPAGATESTPQASG